MIFSQPHFFLRDVSTLCFQVLIMCLDFSNLLCCFLYLAQTSNLTLLKKSTIFSTTTGCVFQHAFFLRNETLHSASGCSKTWPGEIVQWKALTYLFPYCLAKSMSNFFSDSQVFFVNL